ncbi:6-pyruvoyl trahydropterin synthase family protein [Salisaeta longa]|uniref:6-pyruvoyl trahydropterin synthase family protein n=1 Tax=Salisaeta longa TaxID=503170 RepID=UPI0003B73954|nr:6-carboxytetrahydropterin synthase [Salisaeta longa]
MEVTKRFRWEAAHRLPWHAGACQHLHGHSYRMAVTVAGTPDARGLLIDFKELKALVAPLVERFDHATFVSTDDTALREAMHALGTDVVLLPFDTTTENLVTYVLDYLEDEGASLFRAHNITRVSVRLAETETCFAEAARTLHHAPESAPAAVSPAT